IVQLAPGITDANDRLVLEKIRGEAFRAQPGAPREALVIRLAPPFLAAQLSTIVCRHEQNITARSKGRCPVCYVEMLFARLLLGATLLHASLPVARAALFRRSTGGGRRSSAITLRKRLHVNTLITAPGEMEVEWGGAFSVEGGFTLPAAI